MNKSYRQNNKKLYFIIDNFLSSAQCFFGSNNVANRIKRQKTLEVGLSAVLDSKS